MPERERGGRGGRRDDLGLRRALGDRLLPLLVAAMTFLASLAVGGILGAGALARHWQAGPLALMTVQVPRAEEPVSGDPSGPIRGRRALDLLRASPGVADARALDATEVSDLLRPWFGGAAPPTGLPLPAVIDLRLEPGTEAAPSVAALRASLDAAVPGAVLDETSAWSTRLAELADSLRACAWLVLAVVAVVAALMVAEAIRGGLLARRETIVIAHGLGATDGYVAVRFARRATALCLGGGVLGTAAALPVLTALATLAAPFAVLSPLGRDAGGWWAIPRPLWMWLPALPLAAAAIGFAVTHLTVRAWLRRLP